MIRIASGDRYLVCISHTGDTYGRGENKDYQLGLKDETYIYNLVQLPIADVVDIACSYRHTLFLTKNNDVYGCGYNANRTIMNNDMYYITTPERIPIDNVVLIGISTNRSIFYTKDGRLHVSGNINTVYKVPENIVQIVCNDSYIAVLKDNGDGYIISNDISIIKIPIGERLIQLSIRETILYCLSSNGNVYRYDLDMKSLKMILSDVIMIASTINHVNGVTKDDNIVDISSGYDITNILAPDGTIDTI